MIKFEEKYVHCFWNDELEGKKGFVADNVGALKHYVETNEKSNYKQVQQNKSDLGFPFDIEHDNGIINSYQFFYYDPT